MSEQAASVSNASGSTAEALSFSSVVSSSNSTEKPKATYITIGFYNINNDNSNFQVK